MVMVSQFYARRHAAHAATVDTIYSALLVGIVPLRCWASRSRPPIISRCWPSRRTRSTVLYVYGDRHGRADRQASAIMRTPAFCRAWATAERRCCFSARVRRQHRAGPAVCRRLRLGVAGVAVATIFAQAFSWLFGVVVINANIRAAYPAVPLAVRPGPVPPDPAPWAAPRGSSRRCSAWRHYDAAADQQLRLHVHGGLKRRGQARFVRVHSPFKAFPPP